MTATPLRSPSVTTSPNGNSASVRAATNWLLEYDHRANTVVGSLPTCAESYLYAADDC